MSIRFRNRNTPRLSAVAVALGLAVGLALAPSTARAQTLPPVGISNPIQSVTFVGGQLVATTTQGQTVPIALSTSPRHAGTGGCPILNLHLGPINLNVLGLVVSTSAICLDITGQHGPGNLLGNLLCSLASLLDGGLTLSQALATFTAQQLNTLLTGITAILNGALNQVNAATVQSTTPPAAGSCTILNLVLGPLDLNLLGLEVHLDNCANGPVTITVSAVPGPNALLGNLLCNLLGSTALGTTLQTLIQQLLVGILGLIP